MPRKLPFELKYYLKVQSRGNKSVIRISVSVLGFSALPSFTEDRCVLQWYMFVN